MYCKKCGKFIGNDSDFCDECAAEAKEVFSEFAENKTENVVPSEPVINVAPVSEPVVIAPNCEVSLGKPIAATILSSIGCFFIYIGIILAGELAAYGEIDSVLGVMFIGLIPSILGLIFGIQSIKHFKATSGIKSGKRIPVLILGIESVAMSGTMLFLAAFILMIMGMLL